jgi:type I restriction enzyme M protein
VLPSNIFAATKVPVAVMLFDKRKTSSAVLFVDASSHAEQAGRGRRIPEETVQQIVSAFDSFADMPSFCSVATPQQIGANEFNLSVSRYVTQEKSEARFVNLTTQLRDIRQTEAELDAIRSAFDAAVEKIVARYKIDTRDRID